MRSRNRDQREKNQEDSNHRQEVDRSSDQRPASSVRRYLVIFGVLAALFFFLPNLLANTPLLGYFINQATAGTGLTIHYQSASLGWFSPVVLHEVELISTNEKQAAQIEQLTVSRSLLSLAFDQTNLGTVHVIRPVIHYQLEQPVEKISQEKPNAKPFTEVVEQVKALPSVELVIEDATLHLQEKDSESAWTLAQINGKLNHDLASEIVLLDLQATVQSESQVGELKTTGSIDLADQLSQLEAQCNNVPLDILRAVAVVSGSDFYTQGKLHGNVTVLYQADRIEITPQLQASDVQFYQPSVLGTQTLVEPQLLAVGSLVWQQGQLFANQLMLQSEQATLTAHGHLPLSVITATDQSSLSSKLASADPWLLQAEVDLAGLANKYPKLLLIKPGTQLQQGVVNLRLENRVSAEQTELQVVANTTPIQATIDGQAIRWEHPLFFDLLLEQKQDRLLIKKVECESSFISTEASGTAENAKVQLKVNLDQLMSDLAKFVDFGTYNFGGEIAGNLQLNRLENAAYQLAGTLQGDHLSLSSANELWLKEPNHRFQVQATIVPPGEQQPLQITSGYVGTQLGADSLALQLVEPVIPTAATPWRFKTQLQGNLNAWQQRVAWLLPLDFGKVAGNANLIAQVSYSPKAILAESLNGTIQQFQLINETVNVFEPELQLAGTANYQLITGGFEIPEFTLVGGSISGKASQVKYQADATSGSPASLTGQIAYRANLGRTSHWLVSQQPRSLLAQGELAGTINININNKDSITSLQLAGEVTNWQLLSLTSQPSNVKPVSTSGGSAVAANNQGGYSVIWQEPKISLAANLQQDTTAASLQLNNLQLIASAVSLTAQGVIQNLSQTPLVNLQGEATYDWQQLSPLITQFAGNGVSISGQETSKFSLQGPLRGSGNNPNLKFAWLSPQLKGTMNLGFDSARLYGIPIGKFHSQTQLQNGIVTTNPLDVMISGGRLTLTPTAYLLNEPPLLAFNTGRVAENLVITPEMCSNWLKYVAPLLADATRVDGKFSLDLQQGNFPLAEPLGGQASGMLTIHGAQVRPGPASVELVGLARRVELMLKGRPQDALKPEETVLMVLPQQQVPFQMVNGRVYHQNLQIQVGKVRLVTSGSVGADQSLDMIASIPISTSDNQNNPLTANLGQQIQIPIRGSLSSPKLDSRALQNLGQKAIDNAAKDLLEKGLNRGLQELFGK